MARPQLPQHRPRPAGFPTAQRQIECAQTSDAPWFRGGAKAISAAPLEQGQSGGRCSQRALPVPAVRMVGFVVMEREQIVFVGTSDLSGHFRGKSFPAADLSARLQRGVGWAPTNVFLSAFGNIQMTTFGTIGEVFLIPDASTRVFVPFDGSATEYFYLGDIVTLDGAPWDFCPRQVLRRALQRMERETGLRLLATFEQEFTYSGVAAHPAQPYELDGYRRQGLFGEALLAAMRQAGVIPDSFLCEYAPRQFEITTV